MTQVTLFSFAVLLIFAVAAFIEIFRSFQRGWLKTLITLANVALSVLLSMLISPHLAGLIADPIFSEIKQQSFYRSLTQEIQAMAPMIELLIAVVISSLLFVLLFFLIRGLIGLITAIVWKAKIKQRADQPGFERETQTWADRNDRSLGAVLGIFSALLVSMVITSPLMGTMDVTGSMIEIVEQSDENIWDNMEGSEEIVEGIKVYSHDIPGNVLYHLGGKYMYRVAASTMLNGQQVYMINEIAILKETADDFVALLPVLQDPTVATEEDVERLDSLCEHLEEMHISDVLLAELLPMGADAWLNGKLFMKVAKPQMNELLAPSFDELLRVCANSNENNACQNTVTLFRIYGIVLMSDILELRRFDFDTVMQYLEESGIIAQLNDELDRNPYMFTVKESIISMAMGTLASQLNAEQFGVEKYEALLTNLAEAVQTVQTRGYGTDEEKVAVMASYVNSYIKDYGVTLAPSITELAAQELLTIESGLLESITAEDIQDFLNAYTQP